MQKKQTQPIIVGVIQKLLDKQTEELKKTFATKDDLKSFGERIDRVESRLKSIDKNIDVTEKLIRFQTSVDIKNSVRELTEVITKFKDEILTTVDPLLQELEVRRQDRDLAVDTSLKQEKLLKDLENRVAKLEKLQRIQST